MVSLNDKVDISMKAFVLDGRFDDLEPGMTVDEVLRTFPDPDVHDPRREPIWPYGNLELHFHNGRLVMIFTDYIGQIDGGKKLRVDPWVLNRARQWSLLEFQELLNHERVGHSVAFNSIGQAIVQISASGVELRFDTSDNGDSSEALRLISISRQWEGAG